MIEVIEIDGRNCPKIFCDSCGEEIIKANHGAIVFKNLMPEGQRSSVAYVHKSFVKVDCMNKAESKVRAGGGQSGWVELGEYLAYLVDNVGMSVIDIETRLSRNHS